MSAPSLHVDGRCLCGHLAWEVAVDPASARLCHCTDCQVVSGSAFRVTVFVTGGFRFTAGEPRTWVKIADSGNRRVLAFRPTCGTSVYSRPPAGEPGRFGLRVGALRQRDVLFPRASSWCSSGQDWVGAIAALPAHAKGSG